METTWQLAPGKSLTSEQLPERLATGSVVKELKLEGDRLHFELETGAGWGSQLAFGHLRSSRQLFLRALRPQDWLGKP